MFATSINKRAPVTPRAEALFQQQHQEICKATDRLFVGLMVIQWVGAVVTALVVSPRTWIGTASQVHAHVWAALVLGGGISIVPIYLGIRHPGAKLTRNVIAAAQVLWSALLIHVSGGRIETHFHVFVSLAFLSFYREWRLLLIPTAITALDHAIRGIWWPQSVYGVFVESPYRWLEHAAWVVFEVVVLAGACRRSVFEMRGIAERQDELETTNRHIEERVHERTRELAASERQLAHSEARLRKLLDSSLDPLFTADAQGIIRTASSSFGTVFGWQPQELIGKKIQVLVPDEDLALHEDFWNRIQQPAESSGLLGRPRERRIAHRNGSLIPCLFTVWNVALADGESLFMGTIRDITETRDAQAELELLNQRLIDSARQAGKAEVATSVLHNVGNVLNSVNVSAEIIQEQLRKSGVKNLTRAAEMLQENLSNIGEFITNDKRGKHLPRFLIDLSSEMTIEEAAVLDEVDSLIRNIDHIKTVIATQQSYSRGTFGGVAEEVSLASLLDDAVHVNTASMRRHAIDINREYDDVPPVLVDKHRLLQIAVNLISNAKYACMEGGKLDHQINLRLRRNGTENVLIEVQDNGSGIAPENLTRIFSHGFTTRKEGHGFGLHSSALAAKELKGKLSAFSEGPGLGATFTLEIPFVQAGAELCTN